MKDELVEFVPDASSRKSATDWLMKVISAKGPMGLHLNGSEEREVQLGNAVAVEEMTREPEPQETARWTGEFTAEDLCGAPAVPVIKVIPPSAKDEVSADDVCWVPEDRRLKPQPAPIPEAAATAAPKLHIVQPAGRERQVEEPVKKPEFGAPIAAAAASEPRLETAQAPEPAAIANPLSFRGTQEAVITAADISREPAPQMVQPIWGAFAGPRLDDVEMEPPAISAADISRDWVLQQMAGPDAADLPSSFKVLKSVTRPGTVATAEAPTTVAAAPVIEAVAAAPTAEVIPPVAEVILPAADAVAIAPEPVEATEAVPEPVVATSPEIVVEVAAEAAEQPDSAEQHLGTAGSVEEAVIGESEVRVELQGAAAPEEVSAEAPAEAVAAVAEPDEADLREIEAALAEAEAAPHQLEPDFEDEVGVEAAASGAGNEARAGESVFAREGFWGNAASGEAAVTTGKDPYEKPLVRELKRAYGLPEDVAEMEKPPEGWISAWKTMLRLGSVLPWMARALPALEAGAMAEPGAVAPTVPAGSVGAGIAQETRQDVAGLRLVQYEIRTTVQDHSMQLKRVEEQLARVRESVESKSSDNADLAENVESAMKLARIVGIGVGGLLVVLIILVMIVLAHGR